MQHETKRRTWRRWLFVTGQMAGLYCLAFLVSVTCFRKPWIEPLPGVQTEMTRPFVREGDLGPDSAYRLMLAAIQTPDELLLEEEKRMAAAKDPAEWFAPEPDPETGWPSVPPTPARTWNGTWADALGKFMHHPWPAEPPPAEPAEEWVDGEMLRSRSFPPPEAPWTRKQYEDILRLNRIFGPQVALLDQALAAPDPQMPTVDSWDFSFGYLTNARQMARWLAVSAHYRAGTGDFAGAFQDFERILGLGNLVSRGGCLINHGAGISCAAIAVDAAWVVASCERVPAPVLKDAARAFLVAADEAEPFVEAIRVEAQRLKNCVHLLYRERRLYHGPDNPDYSPTLWERFNQRTLFWFLPLVGSTPASTVRNLDTCYQHLVVTNRLIIVRSHAAA